MTASSYNYERSFDERHKRFDELNEKQCVPSEAKYCVVCTRNGADGDYRDGFSNDRYHFSHHSTAIAFAQHFSDLFDCAAGVFRVPEFICRVDVR